MPDFNFTNFSYLSESAPGIYELDVPGIIRDFVGELSFALVFFTCVFLFYFFWEGVFDPFIQEHAPKWACWLSERVTNVTEMLARLGSVVFFWVAYQSGIIPRAVWFPVAVVGVLAGLIQVYSLVKYIGARSKTSA